MTTDTTRTRMSQSEAAGIAGSTTSPNKARSSRANGRLGGRPPKYECACGASGRDLQRWTYKGESRMNCLACGKQPDIVECEKRARRSNEKRAKAKAKAQRARRARARRARKK